MASASAHSEGVAGTMGNGGINGLLKKEILSPPGAPRAPGGERIEKGKVVLASLTHGSLRSPWAPQMSPH